MTLYQLSPPGSTPITTVFHAMVAATNAVLGAHLDEAALAKIPEELRILFVQVPESVAEVKPAMIERHHYDAAFERQAAYANILAALVCTLDGEGPFDAVSEEEMRHLPHRVQKLLDGAKPALSSEVATYHAKVCAEVERARHLFPDPDLLLTAFSEEAGELVQAVMNNYYARRHPMASVEDQTTCLEKVRTEAIQAGAMLVRLVTDGDPIHGLPSNLFATKVIE